MEVTKKQQKRIQADFDELIEKAIHHYGLFLAIGECIDGMAQQFPFLHEDTTKPFFAQTVEDLV